MNIKRFASSLTLVAALAGVTTAAGGMWASENGGFYCELVHAIEHSLPLGSPYPS